MLFSFRIHKFEDTFKRNFPGLKTFVENFVGDFIFESQLNQFKENKLKSSQKTFNVIKDSSEFLINCVYYPNICLIAFLNQDLDSDIQRENLASKNHKKILENLAENIGNNYPQIKMFQVNATCHSDFSASFDNSPKKLPNMIIYHGQLQNYYSMNEEFTSENIVNFVKNSLEGKTQYRKINTNEIKFTNKQCEKKLNKYTEDEYIKIQKIINGLEDEEIEEEDNNYKYNHTTDKSDL